jgi:hypothetical protein
MGADCKSVGLRLRRFESFTRHQAKQARPARRVDLWVRDDAAGMAAASSRCASERPRGNIEARSDALRIRVYAGPDPVTGRQVYLRETVPGTDDAARGKARRAMTSAVL